MTRFKRTVLKNSHCTDLQTQYSRSISPMQFTPFCCLPLFTALVNYFLIHECPLFTPRSWLWHFSIAVLHGFSSTTFAENCKFHSRKRPVTALFSSTPATLHAHGRFAGNLTPVVHLLYMSVFHFSNSLLFSAWSILEHCGIACLPLSVREQSSIKARLVAWRQRLRGSPCY